MEIKLEEISICHNKAPSKPTCLLKRWRVSKIPNTFRHSGYMFTAGCWAVHPTAKIKRIRARNERKTWEAQTVTRPPDGKQKGAPRQKEPIRESHVSWKNSKEKKLFKERAYSNQGRSRKEKKPFASFFAVVTHGDFWHRSPSCQLCLRPWYPHAFPWRASSCCGENGNGFWLLWRGASAVLPEHQKGSLSQEKAETAEGFLQIRVCLGSSEAFHVLWSSTKPHLGTLSPFFILLLLKIMSFSLACSPIW